MESGFHTRRCSLEARYALVPLNIDSVKEEFSEFLSIDAQTGCRRDLEDSFGSCQIQEQELPRIFSALFWVYLNGFQAFKEWRRKAMLKRFQSPVNRDSPSMTTNINMLISIKDYEWNTVLHRN